MNERYRRDSKFEPGGAGASSAALTLLELMAALVILGLLLTLVPPALDSVSTRWRVRGAGHQIEGVVRWAQNAAAVRGKPVQVLYDVPEGSYWVRMDEKTFCFHTLPSGVRFKSVRFGEGVEVIHDVAGLQVFPDGTLDGHEITLVSEKGPTARMTFERLTGELNYEETGNGSR